MTCTSTQSVPRTAPAAVAGTPLRLKPVLDGIFRANPSYELLSFDRLPGDQQELFFSLRGDPNFYGILRPRDGVQLPLKSACRDTALLFLSLQQAAKLPAFVQTGRGNGTNQEIAELVLDGVLEMQHEGQMLHGAAAFAALCEPEEMAGAACEIAQLSRDALIYAQSLPFFDANLLASRLYGYGRIPSTALWKARFPSPDAIRQCLQIRDRGKNAARLARHWTELPSDPSNDGWIFWQRNRAATERRTETYKLYVSPHPAFLREAFEALIAGAESGGAMAFKVGRNLPGILRPDKMIAYFTNLDHLHDAAATILSKLEGCPAQGVPFTAQIESPLVSWGIDPPEENEMPPWLVRQSWRLWVSNRLAIALLTARRTPTDRMEPWQFAMQRLRLEGVDTHTWSPIGKEEN